MIRKSLFLNDKLTKLASRSGKIRQCRPVADRVPYWGDGKRTDGRKRYDRVNALA